MSVEFAPSRELIRNEISLVLRSSFISASFLTSIIWERGRETSNAIAEEWSERAILSRIFSPIEAKIPR
jgi:hypothetical protein